MISKAEISKSTANSDQDLKAIVLDGKAGLTVIDVEAAQVAGRLAEQLVASGVTQDFEVACETVRSASAHIAEVCKHDDEVPDEALTDVRALLQLARSKGWGGPEGKPIGRASGNSH